MAIVLDNPQQSIRRDPNGTQTSPFDYGFGNLRPAAALDPGLVYEFDSLDVINFLCSIGASRLQLKNLTGNLVHCQNPPVPSYNFNYPSTGLSNLSGSLCVYRRVTYYGNQPTTYVAIIHSPPQVNITVEPEKLKFARLGKICLSGSISPHQQHQWKLCIWGFEMD